ncbi:uncharacterized protein Z518_11163 [Rhinocladiella mackenziei CBS 650.93]|uniref:Xylanolytic transcriptional activator regulatory domain-containing protein n=1 Tax=Rhinocladiella mackenziei CBS 650.93 TaxID=1442369 RepID=A0A0D2I914_9EURO|nr:uncharacterized protein Z518_11163 [Rhinocladiella mackenziei CBS 650.93]KIW99750.1 hypothetical protein Z518_11163 [Rhinocladiella mackenziei CBS 650.93]
MAMKRAVPIVGTLMWFAEAARQNASLLVTSGANSGVTSPLQPLYMRTAHSQSSNAYDSRGIESDRDNRSRSVHAQPSHGENAIGFLGDSGYMSMFPATYARTSADEGLTIGSRYLVKPLSPFIRKCYIDIFDEFCSTFCPILDVELLDSSQSLLLEQALALVTTTIQPALLTEAEPSVHYSKARELFNSDAEANPLVSLIAIMLFYWWSTTSPNVVSKNGSWYWTGVAIRQAQEMGLHKQLPGSHGGHWPGDSQALRSRIWWTLYARERLTSMSQGRPCIIDPDDCTIGKPSPQDFHSAHWQHGEVFVHYVDLCGIVGHVAEHLRRHPNVKEQSDQLFVRLHAWSSALPDYLRLPYSRGSSARYARDIRQLHLPYLSALILLGMKRPERSTHAMSTLAASSIARIFEDFLVGGNLRFLQGMAGWYVTLALLALIRASQVQVLKDAAEGAIEVLVAALGDLAQRWPSAKMFQDGVEQLRASLASASMVRNENHAEEPTGAAASCKNLALVVAGQVEVENMSETDIHEALRYFPGASRNSTPIFDILLSLTGPLDALNHQDDFDAAFLDLFNDMDNPLSSFLLPGYDVREIRLRG